MNLTREEALEILLLIGNCYSEGLCRHEAFLLGRRIILAFNITSEESQVSWVTLLWEGGAA